MEDFGTLISALPATQKDQKEAVESSMSLKFVRNKGISRGINMRTYQSNSVAKSAGMLKSQKSVPSAFSP
jgi:predicted DNA-binding ArsR family transcriptional regulator